MKFNIPFIRPNFPSASDISEDYEAIIASNWFTNFGPFEQKFSERCAHFVGKDIFASSINNCTLGLEAAISILFDTTKSKVIMPSFTFAAGPESIIRSGYTPVFIDINQKTLQPNIEQAEQLISEYANDVAGILLCNIFGVGNTEINHWEQLAAKHNLPLVIDSAAGFGSRYSGTEKVGGRGDCEVFSMHATKPFAIGEGGLITSRNEDFIRKVRSWQNFGFETDRNVHRIGTNAKLQEVNAAIGLRQIEHFEERLNLRRNTLNEYKSDLVGLGVQFQENDELSTVPFVSALFETPAIAQRVHSCLLESGVEARRYYPPLHRQELLKQYSHPSLSLEVTENVADRIISLPVHDNMKTEDVHMITEAIRACLEDHQ